MIVTVYPRRNVVVSNFATDSRGNRLPSYARMFAFLLPLDLPMIYNATVQLTKEDGAILCHEIVFTIRINLLEASVSWLQQSENLFEVEYPLPKIKLTGKEVSALHQESWTLEQQPPIPPREGGGGGGSKLSIYFVQDIAIAILD